MRSVEERLASLRPLEDLHPVQSCTSQMALGCRKGDLPTSAAEADGRAYASMQAYAHVHAGVDKNIILHVPGRHDGIHSRQLSLDK